MRARRKCLTSEGFKIGDLSSVRDGEQIPLAWDPDDPHFVRMGKDGSAFTADEKFSADFPGGFSIRSAFTFSENAPKEESDDYPSHLEDVLEALKGKSDTIYKIPDLDLEKYISDGSKVIARSIIDDVDDKIKSGALPDEAKNAPVVIYVTPSSSKHVDDYASALRRNLESYMKERFVSLKRDVREKFAANAHKACADQLSKMLSTFAKPSNSSYFFDHYNRKEYRDANIAARDFANKRIEKARETLITRRDQLKANQQASEREVLAFFKKVKDTVNDCMKSIIEFQAPDVKQDRLNTSTFDISKSFRKIPSSQLPKIQISDKFIKQIKSQLIDIGAYVNDFKQLEVDLSTVSEDEISGLSPYIVKRWKDWNSKKVSSPLITLNDIINNFRQKIQDNYSTWQGRMKDDFSISKIPGQIRVHIADYVKADPALLPGIRHIAVIADDNMETGISLREMRREFDRLKNQQSPPFMIYGAPLLMIRNQKARAGKHEEKYTGRRKSKISVAPPLSNIPEDSELYRKILDRLLKTNPNLELSSPEDSEESYDSDDQASDVKNLAKAKKSKKV